MRRDGGVSERGVESQWAWPGTLCYRSMTSTSTCAQSFSVPSTISVVHFRVYHYPPPPPPPPPTTAEFCPSDPGHWHSNNPDIVPVFCDKELGPWSLTRPNHDACHCSSMSLLSLAY
ncbi:hypothetical protein FKP32DRAFT_71878 [Trametes sanguinea]|nr:hypothetical protein FKP32DRAFT_71878 [Trametes sanguinea]